MIPFAAKSDSAAALMQIGPIQTDIRQLAQARDAYQRLLTIDPNFGPALNNLANIYSEQLSLLDKAYQLAEGQKGSARRPPRCRHPGLDLLQERDVSQVPALLEQSTAKLPAEPKLQFHLGLALSIVGRRDEAMLALQRAIRASKDFPDKEQARGQIEQLPRS